MALFKSKKSSAKSEVSEDINVATEEVQEQNITKETSENNESTIANSENSIESDDILEERDMFDNGEEDKASDRDISDLVDEVIDYFTIAEPIRLNMLERGKLKKEIFVDEVKAYIAKIVHDPEIQQLVFQGFSSFVWS